MRCSRYIDRLTRFVQACHTKLRETRCRSKIIKKSLVMMHVLFNVVGHIINNISQDLRELESKIHLLRR